MNNEILIRPAHAADAAAIVEFNQAMAHETEGKRLDKEILMGGVEAVFHADGQRFLRGGGKRK